MAVLENPLTLEFFSDFVCPWCYLVTPRIDRLTRRYNIRIKWIGFPLHPDTPEEGLPLADLFQGGEAEMEEALARLRAVAEAEGLPFGPRTHTYNSRLAQELNKWAEEMGRGHEFRRAAYLGYFEQGFNLTDLDVLSSLARSVGLDSGEAREVLEERAYAMVVDEDWSYARANEVVAVPTFRAGGRTVVGAQTFETLDKLVSSAGAVPRS